MQLTSEQGYALLEKHGCYITEICDKCGRGIGPVRFTRKGESGVWCSRECRGDAAQRTIRRGGRPRKYRNNAARQRAYRGRILSVTKPSRSVTETKDLRAQKSPLSTIPLTPASSEVLRAKEPQALAAPTV